MKNTYIYIRYSVDKQESGTSYDRQLGKAHAYCKANGLGIPDEEHIYFDGGKSAYKGEHLAKGGELRQFYDDVADGTIAKGSTLLVENLDRLSRAEMWIASGKLRELMHAGIAVVTLDDGKRYHGTLTLTDGITSLIKQELANDESAKKAGRVAASWSLRYAKARRGEPIKVPLASWLTYGEEGFAVLKEPEAEAVRLIFKLCLEGLGMVRIAQELNKQYKPFRGDKWITASVSGIIKNKATIGTYTPRDNGEPVTGYFAAVVDEATWREAQDAIDGRRVAKATNQTKAFNVWQGIVKCAHCGSALHCLSKGRSGQHYLVCSGKLGAVCTKAKNIRLDRSEDVFRELLMQVDSLSLLPDGKSDATRRLTVVDGAIADKKKIMDDIDCSIKENGFSPRLDSLMRATEIETLGLEQEQKELDRIISKEKSLLNDKLWLKGKMEVLMSQREGRAHASALLKRLKLTVTVFTSTGEPTYIVRNANISDHIYPSPSENGKAILQISVTKAEGMIVFPLTPDQKEKYKKLDDPAQLERADKFLARKLGIKRKKRDQIS